MSDLSVQPIKTLSKYELKLSVTNRGSDGQGGRGGGGAVQDLENRLTKAISEIPNDEEKHEFTTEVLTQQN